MNDGPPGVCSFRAVGRVPARSIVLPFFAVFYSSFSSLVVLFAKLVTIDAMPKGEAADAEQFGCLGLVAVAALERLLDEAALDGGQIDALNRQDERTRARPWHCGHAQLFRQLFAFDGVVAFSEDDNALDDVSQLAHIAGPRICAQRIERFT